MTNDYNAKTYLVALYNQSKTFNNIQYITFIEYKEYAFYNKLLNNFQVALGLRFSTFFIIYVICGN